MIDGKTCFFTGHRDAPESLYPALLQAVERHIVQYGVTAFLVGGYGAFDRMAARAVREAKVTHPGVTLSLVWAYLPELGRSTDTTGYDGTIYPEGLESVPRRYAILRRNQWAVDVSDYLIAYVAHGWGGARQTLEHARAKQKRGGLVITNLAAQMS